MYPVILIIVLPLFPMLVGLVIELSSRLPGFVEGVGRMLEWIGDNCPGPSQYKLIIAVMVFFLLVRILSMPARLTHTRVNRSRGTRRPYTIGLLPTPRSATLLMVTAAVDAAALILVDKAAHSAGASMQEQFLLLPSMEKSQAGNLVFILAIAQALLAIVITQYVERTLTRRMGNYSFASTLYSIYDRGSSSRVTSFMCLNLVTELAIYGQAFFILQMSDGFSCSRFTVIFCFIVVKLLTTVVVDLISLGFDCWNALLERKGEPSGFHTQT